MVFIDKKFPVGVIKFAFINPSCKHGHNWAVDGLQRAFYQVSNVGIAMCRIDVDSGGQGTAFEPCTPTNQLDFEHCVFQRCRYQHWVTKGQKNHRRCVPLHPSASTASICILMRGSCVHTVRRWRVMATLSTRDACTVTCPSKVEIRR